jgi:hypothetical protein
MGGVNPNFITDDCVRAVGRAAFFFIIIQQYSSTALVM